MPALPPGAVQPLTVRQVAARLRMHPATVYGLCERGELTYLRVSNAIRVSHDDLEAFVAAIKGP